MKTLETSSLQMWFSDFVAALCRSPEHSLIPREAAPLLPFHLRDRETAAARGH